MWKVASKIEKKSTYVLGTHDKPVNPCPWVRVLLGLGYSNPYLHSYWPVPATCANLQTLERERNLETQSWRATNAKGQAWHIPKAALTWKRGHVKASSYRFYWLKSHSLVASLWIFKMQARPKLLWSRQHSLARLSLFGPGLAQLTASGQALHSTTQQLSTA